jgi:hypothetical protein
MSMDKIQKDVDALKRIAEALIDRMENIERELNISKGTACIKVQKAATTNSWDPKGARARLEKAAKPVEKSTGEGVFSDRIADIRKRA